MVQGDVRIVSQYSSVCLEGSQYFEYTQDLDRIKEDVMKQFVYQLIEARIGIVLASGTVPTYCQQLLTEHSISFVQAISSVEFYHLSTVCNSLPLVVKLIPGEQIELNDIFVGYAACIDVSFLGLKPFLTNILCLLNRR